MNGLASFVIAPLGAALLLVIFGRWVTRFAGALVTALFTVLTGVVVWLYVHAELPLVVHVGGWAPVDGVPLGIHWVVDSLSLLMLGVVNLIGALVALYSIASMAAYTKLRKYYALLLLLGLALNGVVLAGDLFTLYVFLEIGAISSYILVAFGRGAEELEASFKYQVLGGMASMLVLMAIALVYRLTGTLNIADAARMLSQSGAHTPIRFVGALLLTGFGLKAAIMPFHAWLPDAHPAAPPPVSAMLSGVVIKVLGLYPLCRLFFHLIGFEAPWSTVWMVLGAVSLMGANILALAQWDMKRLLAYCSVSQVGYILVAFALGTKLGLVAGLFHLVNHAVVKSLLFFDAGAIEHATGHRDLRKMGGLAQAMPYTRITTGVASLAIAGLPPFGGFWSKLLIILACLRAGQPFMALWAALGSLITLAAFLKLQRHAFGGEPPKGKEAPASREVAWSSRVAMIVLALLAVGLAAMALPAVRGLILEPAADVLMKGLEASTQLLGR